MSRIVRAVSQSRRSGTPQASVADPSDRAAGVACPWPRELPRVEQVARPTAAGNVTDGRTSHPLGGGGSGGGDGFWGRYVEQRLQHFAGPG